MSGLILIRKYAAGSGPDADWLARASAAGVVYADQLDTLSASSATYDNYQANNIAIDASVKTSGDGSTRIRIPPNIRSEAVGGAISIDLPQQFAAGDDLYIQFRYRVDGAFVAAVPTWNSSVKMVNVHGQDSTCQRSEITLISYPNFPGGAVVSAYHACGNGGFCTSTSASVNEISCAFAGDGLLQQGSQFDDGAGVGYNCHYQDQVEGDGNGNGCFVLNAGVWYTFYWHAHLVTAGGTTGNTFDAYVARDGGAYRQFHRVTAWDWSGTLGNNFFDRFRIDTYMTEMPTDGDPSTSDAFCYFTEAIVSEQPIAAPNS